MHTQAQAVYWQTAVMAACDALSKATCNDVLAPNNRLCLCCAFCGDRTAVDTSGRVVQAAASCMRSRACLHGPAGQHEEPVLSHAHACRALAGCRQDALRPMPAGPGERGEVQRVGMHESQPPIAVATEQHQLLGPGHRRPAHLQHAHPPRYIKYVVCVGHVWLHCARQCTVSTYVKPSCD